MPWNFLQASRFTAYAAKSSLKVKRMKPLVWVGILFIVFGALSLTYQGFTYTHQEKVLDVGPIHTTTDKHERVFIPPILSGLALAGGIALIVLGAKKPS
jgi:hypothetical protein